MTLRFEPVRWPADAAAVVAFLVEHEWPHHGTPHLSVDEAARVPVVDGDVASFWISEGDAIVGLVRLFDLDDVGAGSPLFDLRIATAWRGRGVGRRSVEWLTQHLFETYPPLHRIEATTRADNAAMQAVLARCGYRLEGRFVEAWSNSDGTRDDALSYAILRREHDARTTSQGASGAVRDAVAASGDAGRRFARRVDGSRGPARPTRAVRSPSRSAAIDR